MSFLTKILGLGKATVADVAESVGYITEKSGKTVTAADSHVIDGKVSTATNAITRILEDLIDEIPGVPSVVAQIGAQLVMKFLQGAIAAAAENIKKA